MKNDLKTQENIIKQNKEIIDAVLVTKMMECKGFKIFMKYLEMQEEKIRYQDILGIKDEALSDQKGIALGILEIMEYFKTISRRAEQPRIDPKTGKPEFIKKNN